MRLYKFALVLQLLVLIPYFLRTRYHHESARQVILKVLDTLVHSAPPPVPAIMLLCGFAVIARLRKHGMTLLYPEVLKLGANCDVVCFDKTGTLTGTTVCSPAHIAACDSYALRVLLVQSMALLYLGVLKQEATLTGMPVGWLAGN